MRPYQPKILPILPYEEQSLFPLAVIRWGYTVLYQQAAHIRNSGCI